MLKQIHALSLGAGVQSTTVYLLAMEGKIHLDAAVFADTGDEPQAVYAHLEWLQSLNGPRILICSHYGRRLSDELLGDSAFAPVPFFTSGETDGKTNIRQCTRDYKIRAIDRCIRREILALKKNARIPKSVEINQYFGISLDEARRTLGIKKRVPSPHFPLIELGWTRADCQRYLADRVPHETPRSACVYCPFHSDAEWMRVRENPEDWALAVKVDAAIRNKGRAMKSQMFAHRSCVPLDQVQFKHERQFNMFTTECEGMCGS